MTRRAKRPLNEDAMAKANASIYDLTDPKGRKLDPNSKADADLRGKWMDAYVAAGGELEGDPPRPKPPSDPVAPCPLKYWFEITLKYEEIQRRPSWWPIDQGIPNPATVFYYHSEKFFILSPMNETPQELNPVGNYFTGEIDSSYVTVFFYNFYTDIYEQFAKEI